MSLISHYIVVKINFPTQIILTFDGIVRSDNVQS